MVDRIVEKVDEEQLCRNLEKYRQMAVDLGAADAKVITTDMVIVDERVRAKCMVPLCSNYGTNANCPPRGMDLNSVRTLVSKYKYAIFSRVTVPSDHMCGPDYREKGLAVRNAMTNFEIVSKVEAAAFYDGYYLAMGFGGGPCKRYFCPNEECSALVPGQPCRHALRARVAMEGAGIHGWMMAAKVGWELYPIGRTSQPSDAPCASRLGLVLIH
jgi:predicted metal-binding protein